MDTNNANNKKDGLLEKHVQSVLLTIITAVIIGAYVKVTTINEKVIRIEERAVVNSSVISDMQSSLNRIQIEQMSMKDRIIKLEIQLSDIRDKK